MAINKNDVDNIFGETEIEDSNPFDDYVPKDQLTAGRHKAVLDRIEVVECKDRNKPDRTYKALRFIFQGLGGGIASCQYAASYGPQSKLYAFLSGITPSDEKFKAAMANRESAWKFCQLLIGHLYDIKTQMSPDGKYCNVVSGMFAQAKGKFKKAEPEKTPDPDFANDDLGF